MSNVEQVLSEKITSRAARVAVIGLGYVGLPLTLLLAGAGFTVLGFDVDDAYVAEINSGHSRILDVPSSQLAAITSSGQFRASTDPASLGNADVFIICVPTPLSKTRQPDMTYIQQAMQTVGGVLGQDRLVILESTTYPGTTDEVLLPYFEGAGRVLDLDFLLAFSPERVDPGNQKHPLSSIPKLVGGVSGASGRVAAQLYATMFKQVHPLSNARAAELAKLLENTFRNVNIALANEFAQICDALGVNVWEVIEGASTKPFGFMPFYPGPGIGGHCIPLDPQYLVYKARLSGYEPRLVALADQINQDRPRYVVQQVMDRLNESGRALRGARILVVGVAYKPDVPDLRESPALPILEELLKRGAQVDYLDPHIPQVRLESGERLRASAYSRELVRAADLTLILTAHQATDHAEIAAASQAVLDTRDAVRKELART